MNRYIDADKLQETFKELHGGKRSLLIDTEPTADVRENVKGEWMIGKGVINCSACKKCSWSMSFEDLVKSFKYCPNCGADMRGGKHGQIL